MVHQPVFAKTRACSSFFPLPAYSSCFYIADLSLSSTCCRYLGYARVCLHHTIHTHTHSLSLSLSLDLSTSRPLDLSTSLDLSRPLSRTHTHTLSRPLSLDLSCSYLPEAGQYQCLMLYLQSIGFSTTDLAAFIAGVGILSIFAQTCVGRREGAQAC